MHSEGYSTWSVCVCLCVCVSVTQHPTFHAIIRATNDTNLSGGWRSKILSDFLWNCFVAKLERFLWYGYMISRPFFTPRKTRMCMNLDHVASGYLVLGETFLTSSIIGHWQYVVCMPKNKGIPALQNCCTCKMEDMWTLWSCLSIQTKKAECNLWEKTV